MQEVTSRFRIFPIWNARFRFPSMWKKQPPPCSCPTATSPPPPSDCALRQTDSNESSENPRASSDNKSVSPPPASRTTNPGRPQARSRRRRAALDHDFETLPLSCRFPLPLEDPLALELSRRFPVEPLASKPSPHFCRRTPPRTGRWQQRMLQITKQHRIGEHPVHRTAPNARNSAVKPSYDFIPLDGEKQRHPIVRRIQDRWIAPGQPPQSLAIHPEVLGSLEDIAEMPAQSPRRLLVAQMRSDAGRFENIVISDQPAQTAWASIWARAASAARNPAHHKGRQWL